MTYQLKPNLLFQSVADEMVILDPDSGHYFTLDEVGRRMLEVYGEKGSIEQSIPPLCEEYDTDADTLQQDLERLLQEMAEQGLAERMPSVP